MPDFRFKSSALQTARLELRKLTEEDAYDLMFLRSNNIVNEFIDRPAPSNYADALAFIQNVNERMREQEAIYWGITLKGNNSIIGTICLWNLSFEHHLGELGYELHPDFHGRGLMQEAIEAVLAYGFEQMKLLVITALPQRGNVKSIQLLIKNKFIQDESYRFVRKEDAIGYLVYYLLSRGVIL